MAEENIKRFTKAKFIDFIKNRLQNVVPAIINQVNFADTHPSLIVFKNQVNELFKLGSNSNGSELTNWIKTENIKET